MNWNRKLIVKENLEVLPFGRILDPCPQGRTLRAEPWKTKINSEIRKTKIMDCWGRAGWALQIDSVARSPRPVSSPIWFTFSWLCDIAVSELATDFVHKNKFIMVVFSVYRSNNPILRHCFHFLSVLWPCLLRNICFQQEKHDVPW